MILCRVNGKEFKAYSFDEVRKGKPGLLPVESVSRHAVGKIPGVVIMKKNGFRIALFPGEFVTVWEDGDVLTASAATVEQYRIK